jgi:hypothetical protein
MRTEEQFAKVWKELERFVKFHKKSVWLVPTLDDYNISIIEPKESDIPVGTTAIEYDVDLNSITEVIGKYIT